MADDRAKRIPWTAALEPLHALRRDEIVVATMGAAREWRRLSDHPLDLLYVPSAMGQAPALGLGLALARPERQVIVLNGDGCMLMSLGTLVTLAASGASNLTLCVLDNGVYEVTGGQPTAAVAAGTDYAQLARGAGFISVRQFNDPEAWRAAAAATLALPGPRFLWLQVAPATSDHALTVPGPMAPRLARLTAALGS